MNHIGRLVTVMLFTLSHSRCSLSYIAWVGLPLNQRKHFEPCRNGSLIGTATKLIFFIEATQRQSAQL